MKFKTTAIALAVAGTVAAPMAAQADIGAYASGRIGLEVFSSDNVDAVKIKSHGSRFGIKGENDMGNGLTSFGHYEIGIAENATSGELNTRNLHVGLRGDFGEVKIGGETYSAFYNHVTGPVDQPWWENGFGFLSTGRTKNVINYEGGSGAFAFGVAFEATGQQVNGEDEGQGYQLAGSIDIGPVKLGAGIISRDSLDLGVNPGEDIVGVTISGDAGSIYYALTFQQDENIDGIEAYLGFGNFYLNYGSQDSDLTGNTPAAITLGYTQSIGRGTSAWYEYVTYDADDGVSANDFDKFHAVLKVDWK